MKNVIYNFCESIINNNNPPEIINSISSLAISIVPLVFGFPKNSILLKILSIIFILTGFSSAYFHYYLNWIGKQADEICMLLLNLIGNIFLIKNLYQKNSFLFKFFNFLNFFIFSLILIKNLQIKNVLNFPKYYLYYTIVTLFFLIKYNLKKKIKILKNILISLTGFIFWIISEKYCNKITFLGHSLWHILFPIGFFFMILSIDKNFNANN